MYRVKEIYLTVQGEGVQTGRRAVFCRFSGCNLWSGLEADRSSAVCRFCDTDFVGTDGPGGGVFASGTSLAKAVRATWDASPAKWDEKPFVVCTGGEPLLQMNTAVIRAFKRAGLEIAVETNGTIRAPEGIDWICVSPKVGARLKQRSGDELKLVYPQRGMDPERMLSLRFDHFLLQAMDGPDRKANTKAVRAYCKAHSEWQVSVQTHKLLGIP